MTIYPVVFRTMLMGLCLALLAACTSSTLKPELASKPAAKQQVAAATPAPAANVGKKNALAPQPPVKPAEAAVSGQTLNRPAAKIETASLATNTATTFTFLPVSGAPQNAVGTLSRSLRANAGKSGLALVPANQGSATYQVKGYFSALDDGSGTLVIYVWDILDASGKRLHRINGQERSPSKAADPWQAISQAELASVAATTVASLNAWLSTTQ